MGLLVFDGSPGEALEPGRGCTGVLFAGLPVFDGLEGPALGLSVSLPSGVLSSVEYG